MLVTAHGTVDAAWSDSVEARETLGELEAYQRLLSVRRAEIDSQLLDLRERAREIRRFLGSDGPRSIGALLTG